MSDQLRILEENIEFPMTFTPAGVRMIDDLADRTGKGSDRVILIGIGLLKIAVDAKADGNRIAIMDGELEEVIQEILVPGIVASEPAAEAKPDA